MRFPDFMVIGSAKGGTSSLYQYLCQHPLIYMPANKEPYYFSFDKIKNCDDPKFKELVINDELQYLKLFAGAEDYQRIGEASTSYLYTYEVTIPKLKRTYGEQIAKLRLYATLRNPVDRAFSHYSYLVRNGVETSLFEEAIRPEVINQRKSLRYWDFDYLNYGLYSSQVAAYKKYLPQTRFYLFEDIRRPEHLLKTILADLEIDQDFQFSMDFAANPSGKPTNMAMVNFLAGDSMIRNMLKYVIPDSMRFKAMKLRDVWLKKYLQKMIMQEETKTKLKAFYREDILKLQDLLDRDLGAWL